MGAFRAAVFLVLIGSAGQSGPDPGALLKEADRLAWLRAWSAAEPHYLQAQKLFAARGDERNALAMTQRYSHLTPASLDSTIRLLDNRPQSKASGTSWAPPAE